jgi:hypothetical protein
MNPKIGFVMLTHTKPHQIERLIGRLNVMFNHPPIACHHDFYQCALPTERFPKNVLFVRPHVRTAWASFSVVQANVRAIELLYAAPGNPDWFVVLSGSDYPIKPAERILHDLQAGDYDAHICFTMVRTDTLETVGQRENYDRYCRKWLRVPFTKKNLILKHPLLTWPFLPFSKNFNCYFGSNWFSANRRVAYAIIESYKSNIKLANYYKGVIFPEESYFQTVLANLPALNLNNNNWRYTDWSPGGPHPKVLGLEDLPKLLASPDHFARKFDLDRDAAIFNQLDKATS